MPGEEKNGGFGEHLRMSATTRKRSLFSPLLDRLQDIRGATFDLPRALGYCFCFWLCGMRAGERSFSILEASHMYLGTPLCTACTPSWGAFINQQLSPLGWE